MAAAIKRKLPQLPIVFFGDTAHLPYGDKSTATIRRYTERIAHHLIEDWGCAGMVIACNTASAVAGRQLRHRWKKHPVRWFDVIEPAVEMVARMADVRRVGVIATKRTTASRAYPRRLKRWKHIQYVHTLSTPLLAPMIEEGFFSNQISRTVIGWYLGKPALRHIDLLLLGCTHYPLIQQEIWSYYEGRVRVIDSAEAVAEEVAAWMSTYSVPNVNRSGEQPEDVFLVSDYTHAFQKTAQLFFGEHITLRQAEIK